MESERNRREVERKEKDQYTAPAEGKERYMFMLTSAQELASAMADLDHEQRGILDDPTAPSEINVQFAIVCLDEAIMDGCPITSTL